MERKEGGTRLSKDRDHRYSGLNPVVAPLIITSRLTCRTHSLSSFSLLSLCDPAVKWAESKGILLILSFVQQLRMICVLCTSRSREGSGGEGGDGGDGVNCDLEERGAPSDVLVIRRQWNHMLLLTSDCRH